MEHFLVDDHVLVYYLVCLNYKMRFGRVSPLLISNFTHIRGQYWNIRPEDQILQEPPSGQGANLTVRYKLPR